MTEAQIIAFPSPARLRQRLRREAADTALVFLGMSQRLAASENAYVHKLGQALSAEITKTLSVLAQEGE